MWLLALPGAPLRGALGVLAPLQLSGLGWGTLGVAATFVAAAAVEALLTPLFGRWSDRRGRLAPVRVRAPRRPGLALVIPWMDSKWTLSVVIVAAGVSFATLWTPAMAMMSEGWEARGLGHGLGFALMNFAWAPGNVVGAPSAAASPRPPVTSRPMRPRRALPRHLRRTVRMAAPARPRRGRGTRLAGSGGFCRDGEPDNRT